MEIEWGVGALYRAQHIDQRRSRMDGTLKGRAIIVLATADHRADSGTSATVVVTERGFAHGKCSIFPHSHRKGRKEQDIAMFVYPYLHQSGLPLIPCLGGDPPSCGYASIAHRKRCRRKARH